MKKEQNMAQPFTLVATGSTGKQGGAVVPLDVIRRRMGEDGGRTYKGEDAGSMMDPEELAMQGSATDRTSPDFVVIHPLDPEDAAITAAMRAMVSSLKGVPRGIEARGQFDALM